MCSFVCEGWQNETCFLSVRSFMTKSNLSLRIEKQYLHKVSFWKYSFYLHVSTRCCPASSFWWNERSKRHEKFLEFGVRFASILKMSIKWNSGPRVQNNSPKTLTLLDDGMSCLGWHCTFRIAVNTVWDNETYFREYGMCVKLLATLNIQLEYIFYTWGNAQSLWIPLFCHQVIISVWRRSVLQ